jgi:hypothetical protein
MIKTCQNCKAKFTVDNQDKKFYEKMGVPAPTFCPECRLERRLLWVNAKALYSRTLPGSGKQVISMYSQDKPYHIMEDKEWWSDSWDPLSYGKEYDFSKPFFEQFGELLLHVPLPHLQREYATMINSDYCNAAGTLKDCYLVSMADASENCQYGYSMEKMKDCVDVTLCTRSELCYESGGLIRCYRCIACEDCEDSQELIFCRDCIGCNACFGSINLRNKSYHIFNKPYSRQDYYKKIRELDVGSYASFERTKKESNDFFLRNPRKFMHGRKNENVIGDYINESRNVTYSFITGRAENCKYSSFLKYLTTGTKDAYDYTQFGVGAELIYEAVWCGLGVSNIKFSYWNYGASSLEYCFGCHSSNNVFGCIGLRHKKYCILNKQYTKNEYEALVQRIKQHMQDKPYKDRKGLIYRYGEFFPGEFSPFRYNETMAQEYLPLTESQAKEKGFSWKEPEERNVNVTLLANDMPDHIEQVSEKIGNEILECQHKGECNERCTIGFRVIPPEMAFYRQAGIPLPRFCPNCRHFARVRRRNPLKLWHRACMCGGKAATNNTYKNTINHFHKGDPCLNEFETSYSPNRPEIVYCEQCYLAEVA